MCHHDDQPATDHGIFKLPEWLGMDIVTYISDYANLEFDTWQLLLN